MQEGGTQRGADYRVVVYTATLFPLDFLPALALWDSASRRATMASSTADGSRRGRQVGTRGVIEGEHGEFNGSGMNSGPQHSPVLKHVYSGIKLSTGTHPAWWRRCRRCPAS